ERAQLVRQTPLRDHVARQHGCALDVVRRTRGYRRGTERQFLGDTATEQARDRRLEALLAVAVTVFLRQEERDAQRTAARDDRDLVHRVMLGEIHADD